MECLDPSDQDNQKPLRKVKAKYGGEPSLRDSL